MRNIRCMFYCAAVIIMSARTEAKDNTHLYEQATLQSEGFYFGEIRTIKAGFAGKRNDISEEAVTSAFCVKNNSDWFKGCASGVYHALGLWDADGQPISKILPSFESSLQADRKNKHQSWLTTYDAVVSLSRQHQNGWRDCGSGSGASPEQLGCRQAVEDISNNRVR